MADTPLRKAEIEKFAADLFRTVESQVSARMSVKAPLHRLRVRFGESRVAISILTRDRTGIVDHVTNHLMRRPQHMGLSIRKGYTIRLDDLSTSTFLISGPPEQLRAFKDTLRSARREQVSGEVFQVSKRFEIRFRARDQVGLLGRVAAILSRRGINMVFLLSTIRPDGEREIDWACMHIQIEVSRDREQEVPAVTQQLRRLAEEDPDHKGQTRFEEMPPDQPHMPWPADWE